jgi:hypothetical protein
VTQEKGGHVHAGGVQDKGLSGVAKNIMKA